MKHWIIFIYSLFSLSAVSCKESSSNGVIKTVSPKEVQILLVEDSIQLVDVRTPEEFKEGFIEGAQNIDYKSSVFDSEIKKLDKTKPVILYCKLGGRSAKSSKKFLKAGFLEIYDLEGGITKWKEEGLKVEFD